MVNMKMDKKKMGEMPKSISADAPQYPYGLRISLEEDAIEKLGLESLPKVGQYVTITAKAEVCSCSQHESENGAQRSIQLQITDMELGGKKSADHESKLYGDED